MFDITKETKLSQKLHKKYIAARAFIYLAFLASVFFVSYRILFPSSLLTFSFDNVNSLKNTLVPPRNSASEIPGEGVLKNKERITFDASPMGHFSRARISFSLAEKANIEQALINMRKSYQAFFMPEGDPAGFRNGTLLTTNGNFYIVSDGFLRKFSSTETALNMGYAKDAFLQVTKEDLKYNKTGGIIEDAGNYPNDTLFVVDENYYQLKDGELFPFVSAKAFLSKFEPEQAIGKNEDFLENHPVSEEFLGYADGTLASFDGSVLILSGGKSYPIINAETFVSMGYDWNEVIPLDSEEISIYDKQKQFNRNQPHPDGTLFFDRKTEKNYLISDNHKLPMESNAVARTYQKQRSIVADSEESQQVFSCQLGEKELFSNVFSCSIPLDEIGNFWGNDYQIETAFPEDIRLAGIDVTFYTSFTWENFMLSLSTIKNRILMNYIPEQQL